MWDIIGPLVGLDSGSLPWVLWGAGGAELILFPSWSPTTCLFTQTRAHRDLNIQPAWAGLDLLMEGWTKISQWKWNSFFGKVCKYYPEHPSAKLRINGWKVRHFQFQRNSMSCRSVRAEKAPSAENINLFPGTHRPDYWAKNWISYRKIDLLSQEFNFTKYLQARWSICININVSRSGTSRAGGLTYYFPIAFSAPPLHLFPQLSTKCQGGFRDRGRG